MNGVGWVCDECGKTEVVPGDHWQQQGNIDLPDGWYVLYKTQPVRAAANERWDFCSTECIHAQTQPPRHLWRSASSNRADCCGEVLPAGTPVTADPEYVTCPSYQGIDRQTKPPEVWHLCPSASGIAPCCGVYLPGGSQITTDRDRVTCGLSTETPREGA